jgi:hypothetical protein
VAINSTPRIATVLPQLCEKCHRLHLTQQLDIEVEVEVKAVRYLWPVNSSREAGASHAYSNCVLGLPIPPYRTLCLLQNVSRISDVSPRLKTQKKKLSTSVDSTHQTYMDRSRMSSCPAALPPTSDGAGAVQGQYSSRIWCLPFPRIGHAIKAQFNSHSTIPEILGSYS